MSRQRCVVAALPLLLLAACGTTVDAPSVRGAGALVPGSSGEPELGAGPPEYELGEKPGAPGQAAGAAPPGQGPAGPAVPEPEVPGASGTDTPGAAGPAAAAPVRPTSIQVGIPYPAGADEANAAAGSNAGTGNPQQQWKILIDELNSRGGVAGSRLQPVWFRIDASGDFTSQAEAACAHFTEDNRVVAVLGSGINFTPASYYDCLDRAGVAVIGGGGSADRQDLAKRPRMLLTDGVPLDRAVTSTVEGLAAQGWLAKDSRIGVVTYDETTFRRVVSTALEPALERQGATLAEERYVSFPESTAGYGPLAAQTSNAVLRFNTERIDRVLFIELGGEIALFFMQAAESQGYRPVYGLSSNDGGTVLAANVPQAQLKGARGIGWFPAVDVASQDDPMASSAARQRCLKIFAAKGVTFSDPNALAIGTAQCDMVRLLELAGARATALTGDGIAAGATQLGASFTSAVTFSTVFSRERRGGAASYRPTAFADDCTCFRYVGAERRIP